MRMRVSKESHKELFYLNCSCWLQQIIWIHSFNPYIAHMIIVTLIIIMILIMIMAMIITCSMSLLSQGRSGPGEPMGRGATLSIDKQTSENLIFFIFCNGKCLSVFFLYFFLKMTEKSYCMILFYHNGVSSRIKMTGGCRFNQIASPINMSSGHISLMMFSSHFSVV